MVMKTIRFVGNDFRTNQFIFTPRSLTFVMMANKSLSEILGIQYPIIMAPMFLVSNAKMLIAAGNAGITGAVPALNYRTDEEFRAAITEIRSKTKGPIGINIIVNKSNPKAAQHLKTCVEMKVDYIITSLGSPEEVIRQCKPHGIKVFCDVVDLAYAKNVESLGADAVIAVNNQAGWSCRKFSTRSN
jgi:nitronate monooxygenase